MQALIVHSSRELMGRRSLHYVGARGKTLAAPIARKDIFPWPSGWTSPHLP
jgi:hypothetical protein